MRTGVSSTVREGHLQLGEQRVIKVPTCRMHGQRRRFIDDKQTRVFKDNPIIKIHRWLRAPHGLNGDLIIAAEQRACPQDQGSFALASNQYHCALGDGPLQRRT